MGPLEQDSLLEGGVRSASAAPACSLLEVATICAGQNLELSGAVRPAHNSPRDAGARSPHAPCRPERPSPRPTTALPRMARQLICSPKTFWLAPSAPVHVTLWPGACFPELLARHRCRNVPQQERRAREVRTCTNTLNLWRWPPRQRRCPLSAHSRPTPHQTSKATARRPHWKMPPRPACNRRPRRGSFPQGYATGAGLQVARSRKMLHALRTGSARCATGRARYSGVRGVLLDHSQPPLGCGAAPRPADRDRASGSRCHRTAASPRALGPPWRISSRSELPPSQSTSAIPPVLPSPYSGPRRLRKRRSRHPRRFGRSNPGCWSQSRCN